LGSTSGSQNNSGIIRDISGRSRSTDGICGTLQAAHAFSHGLQDFRDKAADQAHGKTREHLEVKQTAVTAV
jgi:hypothetical protein